MWWALHSTTLTTGNSTSCVYYGLPLVTEQISTSDPFVLATFSPDANISRLVKWHLNVFRANSLRGRVLDALHYGGVSRLILSFSLDLHKDQNKPKGQVEPKRSKVNSLLWHVEWVITRGRQKQLGATPTSGGTLRSLTAFWQTETSPLKPAPSHMKSPFQVFKIFHLSLFLRRRACGRDLHHSAAMATESYIAAVHTPYITLCQGHRLCSTYKWDTLYYNLTCPSFPGESSTLSLS